MPKDFDHAPADRSTEPGRAPTGRSSEPVAPTEGQMPVSETPKPRARKRLMLGVVALVALGVAGWYGHGYWTNGRFLVSTDDAYVQADFAILAPKVTGYVASVPAVENAAVKAGDPLVVLNDGDYRDALALAQSQLDAQTASIARINLQANAANAAIAQANAKVTAAKAVQVQARADLRRYVTLASTDVATTQRLEAARATAATADADVLEAEAGVRTAEADLQVIDAQVTEARAVITGLTASRDKAQRDLDDTVLRAPTDGVIGNLSVAQGDYVTPGARLLAVVPLSQVYVEANFKETQIEELAPGTRVDVEIDAFPGRHFTGSVQGVSPASGAVFSLLPPENATGNFTKVVQRLPVRIAVPAEVAAEGWLRPGLSVIATADPRTTPDGTAGTPAAEPGAATGALVSSNAPPAN